VPRWPAPLRATQRAIEPIVRTQGPRHDHAGAYIAVRDLGDEFVFECGDAEPSVIVNLSNEGRRLSACYRS